MNVSVGTNDVLCNDSAPPSSILLQPLLKVVPVAAEWDDHWQRQSVSLFGSLCSWYRRQVRSRSVAWYFNQYFPKRGTYAECGAGTSETSCRIQVGDRKLIAIDWSLEALKRTARVSQIADRVHADIRSLPFDDQSLDGIWNLGVMEHFETSEQLEILREFHRVLRPNGRVLLWWPPKLALDHFLLSSFGWHFPSEPGRVDRRQAANLLRAAGFEQITVDFPANDGFTELVVQGVATRTSQVDS